MTIDDDTDDEPNPMRVGFWAGLEVGREGRNPLPANPYYLHTPERQLWARGYILGRHLGVAQEEHAKRFAEGLKT